MRFSVLASDSSGNCCFVESGGTKVLIDAGTSRRFIREQLASIGESLDDIQAVCVTHDHDDHSHAAGTLNTGHNIPLYATLGTAEAVNIRLKTKTKPEWRIFAPGSDFTIGALTFHSFHTPHDASEPIGFVVRDATSALGFATDMGEIPEMVVRRLQPCNALLLEFNHEVPLLMNHPTRPWDLKQRIRGRTGHLSNDQAAELLTRIAGPHLRTVFLAHISDECNTPEHARAAAAAALRSINCSPL
ncbi:MAG: MBL fold metallo-hydrolase, partial [Kiritimatiellaeota bacterium]|nr:MBL fold metallo-hydrolase [Kiritimatiellota bacterium]